MTKPRFYLKPFAVYNSKVCLLEPNTNATDLDFTRNSVAKKTNSKGIIEDVAINIPRLNFAKGDKYPSLLFERSCVNLITHPEDFSNAFWNQTTATVTASIGINPEGTSGTYFVENVGSGNQLGASFAVTIGNDYTSSWFVRKISGTGAVIIKDTNNVDNNFTATSEWQRFSATANASSVTGRCYIQVPTGDKIEVYGAQFEEKSYASSYTGTVTRAAEAASKTGLSSYINSTEGVFYAEIAANANDGTPRIFGLSNGLDFDNSVLIRYSATSNRITAQIRLGGSYVVSLDYDVADSTLFSKVAFKYKENDFALWVDGIERATSSSGNTITGLDSFGFSFVSGNEFDGKVKDLRVYYTIEEAGNLSILTT